MPYLSYLRYQILHSKTTKSFFWPTTRTFICLVDIDIADIPDMYYPLPETHKPLEEKSDRHDFFQMNVEQTSAEIVKCFGHLLINYKLPCYLSS